jgi:hypothetical protein
MKKMIYEFGEDSTYDSLERLKYSYFYSNSWDTFSDYISDRKSNLLHDKKWCKERNVANNVCDYYILKQEIEEMLTRRDPLEIINIFRTSNDYEAFKDIKELAKQCPLSAKDNYEDIFQEMERTYYEFYHEDKNFRPELIKTPIDELKKMQF